MRIRAQRLKSCGHFILRPNKETTQTMIALRSHTAIRGSMHEKSCRYIVLVTRWYSFIIYSRGFLARQRHWGIYLSQQPQQTLTSLLHLAVCNRCPHAFTVELEIRFIFLRRERTYSNFRKPLNSLSLRRKGVSVRKRRCLKAYFTCVG